MLKENINKLDTRLKELFEEVEILEKSNKSDYYFDITVKKLTEGKRVAVRCFISKKQLEKDGLMKWRYLSDTRDENSFIVERYSSIDDLAEDLDDIVVNAKLDRDYMISLEEENLQENIGSVENNSDEEITHLVEMLKEMDVEHLETHSVFEDNVIVELAHFKHNLKPNDKKRVQMALEGAGYTDIMWNENRLFVKYCL